MNKFKITRFLSSWLYYIYLGIIPFFFLDLNIYHLITAYCVFWFLSDFTQSMFLHRWASHNLWSPPVWLQKFLSIVSSSALIGNPISWSAWHRTHHAYVDTEKDPHSPKYKSMFYIIFRHKYHYAQIKRSGDRIKDKFFQRISKYELEIIIISNLTMFLILPFDWFIAAWAMPVALTTLITNLTINVFGHSKGIPVDRPWLFPIMFNESWHSKHHLKAEISHTPLDISAWIIKICNWDKIN